MRKWTSAKLREKVVHVERDTEWHSIVDAYLDVLHDWKLNIDHEDGSTAPFTSLAMEEVCQSLK